MKRLTENITSSWMEAANGLRGRGQRRRIVAFVESYDDVLFWRTLLYSYEDDTRYFEVMLPVRSSLERGKRSALMSLANQTGRDMIACVDADYDYLMQGRTTSSRFILESPYVLHTYAYAIENMQCYAPSLHNVCVMVTLNDHATFDFAHFMAEYSRAVHPLFVWSIWCYREGHDRQFTITDFNKCSELRQFSSSNPERSLEQLREKVGRKCRWLRKQFAASKKEAEALDSTLQTLSQEMERLGVTPETTYLYVQGHHLFNKIVVPIVSKVCLQLIREREGQIRTQAVHATQMHNELSCYANSTQDVEQMLKKNVGYVLSAPFRKMRDDLERLLENL